MKCRGHIVLPLSVRTSVRTYEIHVRAITLVPFHILTSNLVCMFLVGRAILGLLLGSVGSRSRSLLLKIENPCWASKNAIVTDIDLKLHIYNFCHCANFVI